MTPIEYILIGLNIIMLILVLKSHFKKDDTMTMKFTFLRNTLEQPLQIKKAYAQPIRFNIHNLKG